MSPIDEDLDFGTRSLEDAFFMEQDKILIAKLKEMKRMKETKESLSKVSGIHDEDVLQKLVDLDVRPEVLAALALVPLIEVAWADGTIDDEERASVKKAAHQVLPKNADVDFAIIDRWLEHRPPAKLLTAWTHYMQGLCGKLNKEEKAELKKDFLGHAKSIAQASGGFLGLGSKISREEKAVLDKMESVFAKH